MLNTSDLVRPLHAGESEIVVSRHLLRLLQQHHPLGTASLGARTGTSYQNMHHKFAVADDRVVFGSLNWTTAALENNFECLASTDDSDAIARFTLEFDRLWSAAQEFFFQDGRVRMIMCPDCKSSFGVDFESWGPFCLDCGHKFRVV